MGGAGEVAGGALTDAGEETPEVGGEADTWARAGSE
jgi:hypothetical protein